MNGSLDAVVHLDVKFWDLVVFVHASIHNITHGGSVDNVFDQETFDRLILGDHLTSGVTAHGGDVAAGACRTIASVISSFDSHGWVVCRPGGSYYTNLFVYFFFRICYKKSAAGSEARI